MEIKFPMVKVMKTQSFTLEKYYILHVTLFIQYAICLYQ